MDDGLRKVQSRACAAWMLPGDPTCAGLARRLFRQVAAGLALEPESVDDGVTMVSELAANTLHAAEHQDVSVNPEVWLYLRGTGPRAELVCKVFDTLPGWVRGNVPGRTIRRAPADAMSGRGLEVVHELSGGRWGHHLSRARLSGAVLDGPGPGRTVPGRPGFGRAGQEDAGMDGKAVWFSLPAPAAGALSGPGLGGTGLGGTGLGGTGLGGTGLGAPAQRGAGPGGGQPAGPRPATAAEAMTVLERDLGTRGLGAAMTRADDAGANMAVLSIAGGLAVWCRGGVAWLRAPGVPVQQWDYCDLVEVAEQAVTAYESIVALADPFPLVNASSRTGSLIRDVSRCGRPPSRRRRARLPRSGRHRSR